ncbi:family 78 glycoside hydrolase catalytic domain [Actinoplanes sp. CA-054009]
MRVRVEHLDQPFGIGERRPRLSWQPPADQVAYELRLDDGTTTGRVESRDNVLVAWPGRDLVSRERRQVQVRVWTEQGVTPWSTPTELEAGLLTPDDWRAQWIGPDEATKPPIKGTGTNENNARQLSERTGTVETGARQLVGRTDSEEAIARPPAEQTGAKQTNAERPAERASAEETNAEHPAEQTSAEKSDGEQPPEQDDSGQPTAHADAEETNSRRAAERAGGEWRPAYLLRGTWEIEGPVVAARLYATAYGIYELTLNGLRVGDLELAPGFTEYGRRTQVQAYDVAGLLRNGRNEVGAILADGWYRGQVGMPRSRDQFGERTALLAQLHVDHPDGSTTVLGTGGDWLSSRSPIVMADLIEGQAEDRRAFSPHWTPVVTYDHGFDHLVFSPAPPVRAIREIRPSRLPQGVFDLGENINGRVRVTVPAGAELTLTHGEALGADGNVTTDHLRPADVPFIDRELTAGQVDTIRAAEAGVFEPRLTTHGFRYVQISGDVGEVTGVVVHTDLRRTGTFHCDDERLNLLHAAAERSFLGNACDIPTDCPTRERAGWTGDWQIFCPTATFLYDVAGFTTKWLRDLAAGQWENGVVGNMAPMPPAERSGFLARLNGSAGWGDAIVLVPWEIFQEYGDLRLLSEMWPAMTRWLAFVERTDPATRFHWGEWLVPGEDVSDFAAFAATDKSNVAIAYQAHTFGIAAQIAALLGHHDEHVHYLKLSHLARQTWPTAFVTPEGKINPDTQADFVRALTFDLIPKHLRQPAADRLAALIRENGTHLATGFLATPSLLPALATHGHLDLAYDLLFQNTAPSWLTMIDRGATTMWERWDGIDADGIPHDSLNHYSKGAVISFLHRYTAGLQRLAPTWRRFRVQPHPTPAITQATATHDSPHGRISVEWNPKSLTVTVPPGCTAEVLHPNGKTHDVGPGVHTF